MNIGFFTRQEMVEGVLKKPKGVRARAQKFDPATLKRLGPKALGILNARAHNPEMKPTGSDHPLIYLLGSAPSAVDDEDGAPFGGPVGRFVRDHLPRDYKQYTRFNNCVTTLLPGYREPTTVEIEAFRGVVEKDILQSRPRVIVPVTKTALSWLIPASKISLDICRGRFFPVRIQDYECWVYPVNDVRMILRRMKEDTDKEKGKDKIPGKEHHSFFRRDLFTLFDRVDELPDPEIEAIETMEDGITLATGDKDIEKVRAFFEWAYSQKRLAVDLETNHIRPYHTDSKILTIGIGTYKRSIGIAFEHPGAEWSEENRAWLDKAFRKLLFTYTGRFIAHNLKFELEWLAHRYGWLLLGKSNWDDTLVKAYALDERKGSLRLQFVASENLGLPLKDFSNVDVTRLSSEPVGDVCRYNALDCKYEHKLDRILKNRLIEAKLYDFYRFHLKRVAPFVSAQLMGMPVDFTVQVEMLREYEAEIKAGLEKVMSSSVVAEYQERFNESFNPDSNPQMVKLFLEIKNRKEVIVTPATGTKKAKCSVEEEVLTKIGTKFALNVLALRKAQKIRSTYLLPLDEHAKQSNVWPDKRIHPEYELMYTSTGRASARSPNVTNQPLRNAKTAVIRACYPAPEGHVFVAADEGQLEYRVIGAMSDDPFILKALLENYDIHTEWMERIAKRCRGWLDKRFNGDKKAARTAVKNEFVFPSFFGASINAISYYLEIEQSDAEHLQGALWKQCQRVREWQQEIIEGYDKNGFVSCLSGRRRHGPMSHNALINAGVQGTAGDLVMDAMTRLFEMAQDNNEPWRAPILFVHDDISSFYPSDKADEAIRVKAKYMTIPRVDWWPKKVPLTAEVKTGPNWYALKPYKTFDTRDFKNK